MTDYSQLTELKYVAGHEVTYVRCLKEYFVDVYYTPTFQLVMENDDPYTAKVETCCPFRYEQFKEHVENFGWFMNNSERLYVDKLVKTKPIRDVVSYQILSFIETPIYKKKFWFWNVKTGETNKTFDVLFVKNGKRQIKTVNVLGGSEGCIFGVWKGKFK